MHDPAIAPVTGGGSASVRHLLVDGRVRVRDGAIPGLDLAGLRARAAAAVAELN